MNPYGCISMDHRVGMIEVVLNAETIANIQKEKGMFSATSAFKKGSLLGKINILLYLFYFSFFLIYIFVQIG